MRQIHIGWPSHFVSFLERVASSANESLVNCLVVRGTLCAFSICPSCYLRLPPDDFESMSPDIDEKNPEIRPSETDPTALTTAISLAKARALLTKAKARAVMDHDQDKNTRPWLLVTCDQVVSFHGTIREKAESREEAQRFLRSYSKDHISTHSAICVTNLHTGFSLSLQSINQ